MTRKTIAVRLMLVLAAVSLLFATGCGGRASDGSKTGRAVDLAFVSGMAPHHRSAIEMAQIARQRAGHPQIRALAASIIASQGAEIDQLLQMHAALVGDRGRQLGSGGSMSSSELAKLRSARPFDAAFIELMVPHHVEAIKMARVELARGGNARSQALVQRIITAQSVEIRRMEDWYQRWYGRQLKVASTSGQMSGMHHSAG